MKLRPIAHGDDRRSLGSSIHIFGIQEAFLHITLKNGGEGGLVGVIYENNIGMIALRAFGLRDYK